jgi:hypothetical protein
MPAKRLLLVASFSILASCAAGCASETSDSENADDNGSEEALTEGWTRLGLGVAYKSTGNGPGVYIGYAGYSVKDSWSCAWTDELYRVRLQRLGIGNLYCVQGPRDAGYNAKEIANSKLTAHLQAGPGPDAPFIFVSAHSSGTYVANEFFDQISHDTISKIVYADLDGGGITAAHVHAMKHVIFAYAQDTTLGSGLSANAGGMESLGSEFGNTSLRIRQDHSGCHSGAKWCLHDILITTKPHDPDRFDLHDDYTDFASRPIQTAWVDAVTPFLQ